MSEASPQSIGALPAATGALALDTYRLTKRFGSFTAMDSVTMRVEPGTVHALLGENGAGKSDARQVRRGLPARRRSSAS
jgi:ABC-type uncharacterized transport system ATPase subunit